MECLKLCVCVCVCVCACRCMFEREKETETDTKTDTQTQRDRESHLKGHAEVQFLGLLQSQWDHGGVLVTTAAVKKPHWSFTVSSFYHTAQHHCLLSAIYTSVHCLPFTPVFTVCHLHQCSLSAI